MLDRVIAEFEAKQEEQQNKAAQRIEAKLILDENAFPLWMRFRNSLELECKRYPKQLHFDEQPVTDALVRSCAARKTKILSVEYQPQSYAISYSIGRISHKYLMGVDDDGNAVICDHNSGAPTSPKEIAEGLLSLLF